MTSKRCLVLSTGLGTDGFLALSEPRQERDIECHGRHEKTSPRDDEDTRMTNYDSHMTSKKIPVLSTGLEPMDSWPYQSHGKKETSSVTVG